MLKRRPGTNPGFRAAGLFLAAAFGLSASTAPLTMLSCPRHQAGMQAMSGMPHAAASDAPADSRLAPPPSNEPSHEHGGPCHCLGDCAPGLSHAAVAVPAVQARLGPLVLRLPGLSPDGTRPATYQPWFLPYPNGPPTQA
ncbi:MAG: hypothetical protein PVF05_06950 [Gemmatimonadales bacterium]